jgi:hypothetical protein
MYRPNLYHYKPPIYGAEKARTSISLYSRLQSHASNKIKNSEIFRSNFVLLHPPNSWKQQSSENSYLNYCFTSRSRIFHLYGDITIAGEGLQNLGLCSALRAFEQGWIFIVPHLLWHGASVFRSHPKDHPIQSPLTTHKGGCVEDLFLPGSSRGVS